LGVDPGNSKPELIFARQLFCVSADRNGIEVCAGRRAKVFVVPGNHANRGDLDRGERADEIDSQWGGSGASRQFYPDIFPTFMADSRINGILFRVTAIV